MDHLFLVQSHITRLVAERVVEHERIDAERVA
jgi:hypothetical protein